MKPIRNQTSEIISSLYFIPSHQINITQWNDCVQVTNAPIYAQAFYLNAMSPNWGALAGENYDWILPLVFNKKLGVSYLYQPPFAQQLGLHAKPGVEIPYKQIIAWLKANYTFWEVSWNAATARFLADETISQTQASNFTLHLDKGYADIAQNYHNDLQKNLKRSGQFGLLCQPSDDYEQSIDLYIKHYASRTPNVSAKDFDNFKKLCHFAQQNDMLLCRNAMNENENLLATALLLFDGKRLYNMMNTTTDEGRKQSANHFLMDAIIQKFAGQSIIFDFEGSDLPGVKSFYENFGAVNEPYYHIKYNNLPWPLRLFKQ